MNRITTDDVILHSDELPDYAFEWDTWAIDTEFFGQKKERLHRPEGKFGCLTATADGQNVYIIYDEDKIAEFLGRINKATWVFHNAQYDLRQLRRYATIPDRKNLWDTMLIEQIRYSGYYDRFSLADLYRRYCFGYLPKENRKTFADISQAEMTDEQIFYAACDAIATRDIFGAQNLTSTEDTEWTWENVERPFLYTLLDTGGVLLDKQAWMQIADEKKEGADTIYDEIENRYSVNARSNQQLGKFLLSEGLKVMGEDGKLHVDKKSLEKFKGKHDLVDMLLSYRPLQKGASTYGENWLNVIESDGRVYTSWNQCGAKTCRMSSSSPNLQNIPVRQDKRYRNCLVAADGHLFVIGDWSSQEPRTAAYLSEDENLIQIMNDPKADPYVATYQYIFDEKIDKKDHRRTEMKSVFLGLCYGMTPYGLVKKLDEDDPTRKHTLEEAEEKQEVFFDAFPGMLDYVKNSRVLARRNGYVETIWNRKIWLSPYSYRLDQEAPNYRIQGSAGESLKVAASQFRKKWIREFGYNPIKLYVHDEVVAEVTEEAAPYAKEVMGEIMVEVAETMHEGVRASADVFIGKSWGDKG